MSNFIHKLKKVLEELLDLPEEASGALNSAEEFFDNIDKRVEDTDENLKALTEEFYTFVEEMRKSNKETYKLIKRINDKLDGIEQGRTSKFNLGNLKNRESAILFIIASVMGYLINNLL